MLPPSSKTSLARNSPSPLNMPTVATVNSAGTSAVVLDSLMSQAASASSLRTQASPSPYLMTSSSTSKNAGGNGEPTAPTMSPILPSASSMPPLNTNQNGKHNSMSQNYGDIRPPPPPGLGYSPFLGGASASTNSMKSNGTGTVLNSSFGNGNYTKAQPQSSHFTHQQSRSNWNGCGSLDLQSVLNSGTASNVNSLNCGFPSYSPAASGTSLPFGGGSLAT